MKKSAFATLFSILFLTVCSQQSESNKNIVIKLYEEFNARDFSRFYAHFGDSVWVHVSNHVNFLTNAEGIRSAIDPQLKAFPGMMDTISLAIAEKDWVSICVRHVGFNSDSLWGLPPAKKMINYNVMEMYRLKENKIVEVYVVGDEMGMYRQMGIIPLKLTELVMKN